ncbi:MAG TPA: acetate/propionate family kinase [Hyphomicrobiaceae bacterium]|nr:acetate/propionate family kinase [Hyphomicrobiaceae bacterium]
MTTSAIFTINAGSSSLKFSLWHLAGPDDLQELLRGKIEKIGIAPRVTASTPRGDTLLDKTFGSGGAALTHEALLQNLFAQRVWSRSNAGLVAVGHRVVHGGPAFVEPVVIDDAVMDRLSQLEPLAPLHQPHNLSAIRACASLAPGVPQVACFDTAFHHTMAPVARRLGLPRVYTDAGIRRYGFHGLSYEFIARRLGTIDPVVAGGRLIVAHLGNGASLCAMQDGKSIDTTMGFTALDGLLMGTRPGTLDPGAVTYLMRQRAMTASEVEDMLYHCSGLLGVSGISSDMRTLLASNDPRAREAVDLFVFRAAREIGAMAASLGGVDCLVFTAGIGEHAPAIRARICERCSWLGVILDEEANRVGRQCISAQTSRVAAYVIPTDEERMIAAHASSAVMPGGHPVS